MISIDNIIFIHGKDRTSKDFGPISRRIAIDSENIKYFKYSYSENIDKIRDELVFFLKNNVNNKTLIITHSFGGSLLKSVSDISKTNPHSIINLASPLVGEYVEYKSYFNQDEYEMLKKINSLSNYSFEHNYINIIGTSESLLGEHFKSLPPDELHDGFVFHRSIDEENANIIKMPKIDHFSILFSKVIMELINSVIDNNYSKSQERL